MHFAIFLASYLRIWIPWYLSGAWLVFDTTQDMYIMVDSCYGFIDANKLAYIKYPELKMLKKNQEIPQNIKELFTKDNSIDIDLCEETYDLFRNYKKELKSFDKTDEFSKREITSEYVDEFGKHNKKKILVVDDSGAMLCNVKSWLENKYQVILANSGAMAIKYLA